MVFVEFLFIFVICILEMFADIFSAENSIMSCNFKKIQIIYI